MVKRLTITFSENVNVASDAISVKTSRGASLLNVFFAASSAGDLTKWDLTFSGAGAIAGSLPDGLFQLLIAPAGVRDLAGNALIGYLPTRFHRLFGDSDGDRDVDKADLQQFLTAPSIVRPTTAANLISTAMVSSVSST